MIKNKNWISLEGRDHIAANVNLLNNFTEPRYFHSESREFRINLYIHFYPNVFRHYQSLFEKLLCKYKFCIQKTKKPFWEDTKQTLLCVLPLYVGHFHDLILIAALHDRSSCCYFMHSEINAQRN